MVQARYIVCAVVLFYFSPSIYRSATLLGYFGKRPEAKLACTIHHPDTLTACEDMLFWEGNIITACGNVEEREKYWFPPSGLVNASQATFSDRFYEWNLKTDAVREIPHDIPGGYVSHGLDILKDGDKTYLFAVNHLAEGSVVDVLEYDGKALHHQQRASSDLLTSPNAVHAIRKDEFYVTNLHYYKHPLLRALELNTRRAWLSIAHYRAGVWQKAAKKLTSLNGMTGDGEYVYVAQEADAVVNVATREANGMLHPIQTINIARRLDNLRLCGDDLYITYFEDPMQVSAYLRNASKPLRSAFARINKRELGSKFYGKDFAAEPSIERYETDYNGATTHLGVGDEVFVTGLLARGMGRCKMPPPPPADPESSPRDEL